MTKRLVIAAAVIAYLQISAFQASAQVDTDGDGVSNVQEQIDGSNPFDRGSYLPVLSTTLCSEWNGFLGGMWNILEHVNMASADRDVDSTLYSLQGSAGGDESFTLSPGVQVDLLVHDITGWTLNSYGRVCSVVSDGNPGDLDGRMVYYKEAPGSVAPNFQFEFAFAMPLLNGITGRQYVPFNTFQPSLDPVDALNLVVNWIQITNLENSAQTGTLIFYAQDGTELGTQDVELEARARRDFSGHQFGTSLVGIVEWIPDSSSARFQLRNVRYFYDNPGGADTFDAAFQLEGMVGSGELIAAPLDAQDGSSIVEVANTTNRDVEARVRIYDSNGNSLDTRNLELSAHESVHIITDPILGQAQGSVTIDGNRVASMIATVMQYERTATGGIQHLHGILAREALGTTLRGSYNTFLQQGCRLFLTNVTNSDQTVNVGMVRYDGTNVLTGEELFVPMHGMMDYDLCANDTADNYGVVTVQLDESNSMIGHVLRQGRENSYRFPTPVRQ